MLANSSEDITHSRIHLTNRIVPQGAVSGGVEVLLVKRKGRVGLTQRKVEEEWGLCTNTIGDEGDCLISVGSRECCEVNGLEDDGGITCNTAAVGGGVVEGDGRVARFRRPGG